MVTKNCLKRMSRGSRSPNSNLFSSPFTHKFSVILEQFPATLDLDKILFQDESLLWASKLPIRYQLRSLKVILCLISIFILSTIDIVLLVMALSPITLVVIWLPLPGIILPLAYIIHRLQGTHVQVVTSYR